MRRNNGEGSAFHDTKRGRYIYRVSYTDPVSSKKHRKAFYSKKSVSEAKAKASEYLKKLNKAAVQPPLTLSEFLKLWLTSIEPTIRPKTLERYKCILSCNVYPYEIAQLTLDKLTVALFQAHFNQLHETGGTSGKGLAPRTVNATRRLLIGALETGVRDDIITKNPAYYTRPLKVKPTEITVLSHEDAKRLIRCALQHSRYAWAIITLGLGTGMRISEIFGLEWQNVDLQNKTIHVEKSGVTTRSGTLVQDSTKTKTSRRKILLPDSVCYMLKRLKLWQKVRDIRFGTHYSTSPWVLPNPKGNARSPSSFSGHDFKQLLEIAGIDRKFRIHDMRHTHATWLLEAGVNIKVVSERLGHSSIRITLDTYAHVLQTMQQEAVDKLNDIL